MKTVDASSNPYLSLGVVITAGLDGVKQEITLPNPVQEDPAYLPKEELNLLPTSLDESLMELKKMG